MARWVGTLGQARSDSTMNEEILHCIAAFALQVTSKTSEQACDGSAHGLISIWQLQAVFLQLLCACPRIDMPSGL